MASGPVCLHRPARAPIRKSKVKSVGVMAQENTDETLQKQRSVPFQPENFKIVSVYAKKHEKHSAAHSTTVQHALSVFAATRRVAIAVDKDWGQCWSLHHMFDTQLAHSGSSGDLQSNSVRECCKDAAAKRGSHATQ